MTQTPGSQPSGLGRLSEQRSATYMQGAAWADDVQAGLRASRRIAWIVAGAAVLVAVLEAVALAALAPLKTVIPYTLLVDKQTGYVQTLQGVKPGELSQNQAVTQSFLVQYVIARETFDAADLRSNYSKVMTWSSEPVRAQYAQLMDRSNPTSPLAANSPTTVVQTVVKSVSPVSTSSALVRFDLVRKDAGAAVQDVRPYAAVIGYRYSGAPMRMEDRFINPLGFQVTSYRRDAETLGAQRVDAGRAP